MLNLLHLQRFLISPCSRFFAEDVLASPETVDGNGGMDIVRSADRNCNNLIIFQNLAVISYSNAAAVFFHSLLRTLRDYITEIFDFNFLVLHICRDMSRVCY